MMTEDQSTLVFKEESTQTDCPTVRSNSTIKKVDKATSPYRPNWFDFTIRWNIPQDTIEDNSETDTSLAAKFNLKECCVVLNRLNLSAQSDKEIPSTSSILQLPSNNHDETTSMKLNCNVTSTCKENSNPNSNKLRCKQCLRKFPSFKAKLEHERMLFTPRTKQASVNRKPLRATCDLACLDVPTLNSQLKDIFWRPLTPPTAKEVCDATPPNSSFKDTPVTPASCFIPTHSEGIMRKQPPSESDILLLCDLCVFHCSDESSMTVHLKDVHELTVTSPTVLQEVTLPNNSIQDTSGTAEATEGENLSKLLSVTASVAEPNPLQSSGKDSPSTVCDLVPSGSNEDSIHISNNFVCKVCFREFSSSKEQQQHERSLPVHHVSCRECVKVFRSQSFLENHRRLRHSENVHSSETCHKTLPPESDPKNNSESHVRNEMFSSENVLKIHSRFHRYFILDILSCSECKRSFADKPSYRNHLKTHSSGAILCKLCGKSFSLLTNFNTHMDRHAMRFMRFKCSICELSFETEMNLYLHESHEHSNILRYKCMCGKSFSSKHYLKKHMRLHFNHSLRKVVCDVCGMSFARKSQVTKHMIWHFNIPGRFPCRDCGKTFHLKHNLKLHKSLDHQRLSVLNSQEILTNHEKVPIKTRFQCSFCHLKCVTKMELNRHLNKSHARRLEFKCDNCAKSFLNYRHLKEHRKCHFEFKKMACAFCNRKFSRISRLNIHITVRHSAEARQFYLRTCE